MQSSFNGQKIVYGSDKTIKIWNSKTFELENTLEGKIKKYFKYNIIDILGHTLAVNSVNFRNDGQRIVSGSDDKSVKIWNTTTFVVE